MNEKRFNDLSHKRISKKDRKEYNVCMNGNSRMWAEIVYANEQKKM